jgi:hypothetical protein
VIEQALDFVRREVFEPEEESEELTALHRRAVRYPQVPQKRWPSAHRVTFSDVQGNG